MSESEDLSKLISRIYDAALDATLWPSALDGLRHFVGGFSATMFWQDIMLDVAGMHYSVGDDPDFRQLYIDKYKMLNPMLPGMAFIECGQVFNSLELVPWAEMSETRFYKEWLQPQGIVDGICTNLEKTSTSLAALAVIRGEEHGFATAETHRLMGLVVPHMMRAVSISRLIDTREAETAALSETLGRLASGVLLVDGNARIVFGNEAGLALLKEGKLVRDRTGLLTAVDPSADKALKDTVAAAGRGDASIGARGVAVPLSVGKEARWLAHVLPLTSGARAKAGRAHAATAAVFVRKAGLDTPSALETLSKLYRLTASEVRVLNAVVELGGGPAIADALGISATTVKSHLDSLFAKTGVRRQADLVKLVASVASPVG